MLCEGAPTVGKARHSEGVEDDVVGRAIARERLRGVIDHARCPERAHELEVARAAHARHLGAEVPRELHRPDAHAARRAHDEHALPGSQRHDVAQEGERAVGNPESLDDLRRADFIGFREGDQYLVGSTRSASI